jgi:hypothetical protein
MPRTESSVVAYDASNPQHEDWSDPITLTPLAEMRQPVLLNGDASETVYELSIVIAAHRSANGGLTCGVKPFRSPSTRRPIRLRAPGALVAVRWDDSPAAVQSAEATERAIRRMGLEPADAFDPHFQAMPPPPPLRVNEPPPPRSVAEWIALLRAVLDPDVVDFRLRLPVDPRALRSMYVCADEQDPAPAETALSALSFVVFERPPAVANLLMPYLSALLAAVQRQTHACVRHAVRHAQWPRAMRMLAGSALGMLNEFQMLDASVPDEWRATLMAAAETHGQQRWAYMLSSLDATLRGRHWDSARELLVRRLLVSVEEHDSRARMRGLERVMGAHEGGEQLLADALRLRRAL